MSVSREARGCRGHRLVSRTVAGLVLPIETERLRLRLHRPDDLDALLGYYSDPKVARYTPFKEWTRADAEEYLEKRLRRTGIDQPGSALGLVIERNGRVIGDVILWPADDTLLRGEMGWALHPAATGRGYATEAVRALIAIAFGTYGMRRLIAQLDPRNTSSARLCERVGMRREAHLRQDYWSKGEWADTFIFGLLASEWPDAASAAEGRRAAP
jgi:RimJ/RimL family protein N-acetyltransferase